MIASANDVRRQEAWDRNFKGSDKSWTSGYISILWPNGAMQKWLSKDFILLGKTGIYLSFQLII